MASTSMGGPASGELPFFSPADEKRTRWAYRLYLFYTVSFFLHLPARITALALIHSDMVLVGIIGFLAFTSGPKTRSLDDASKLLLILFAYAVLEIPLVTYPGSVLHHGLEGFIKAVIFYFFTVRLIRTEKRLFVLIGIYVACNTFRVLEPLYLHLTTGYWGSATDMGGTIDPRLEGSPYDVINGNGLAFVIASIVPFYHYLFGGGGTKSKLLYLLMLPILLYAMALTLSRSGLLALAIIALSIFIKTQRKFLFVAAGSVVVILFFANLGTVQQERYTSIFNHSVPGGKSAEGRITGVVKTFHVALERPIFGHGLGTSRETNWNSIGINQPAHNLWVETWEEIGLIGLVIMTLYIKTIVFNFSKAIRELRQVLEPGERLYRLVLALQVWMYMNLLFSLASYGLSSYEWYLFGGLSVVILDIAKRHNRKDQEALPVAFDKPEKKHGLADFSKASNS